MISNIESPISRALNGLLILDRDGTLVENIPYLKDKELVKFKKGVFEGLLKAQLNNFDLVVATNQSGVGRNLVRVEEINSIHEEMTKQLLNHGVKLNQYIFCPHHPGENCTCRKPNNSMIEEIIRIKRIDRKKIFLIGDSMTDIMAANKSKIKSILIEDNESNNLASLKDVSKVKDFESAIKLVFSVAIK
jgi:histidinol-phosphate phosphatase family protein